MKLNVIFSSNKNLKEIFTVTQCERTFRHVLFSLRSTDSNNKTTSEPSIHKLLIKAQNSLVDPGGARDARAHWSNFFHFSILAKLQGLAPQSLENPGSATEIILS